MKKRILILIPCAMLLMTCSFGQSIGIGTTTPNVSSILDIRSTSKGLLIPRMTTSEVTSISNPAKGLMVFDTVKNQLMINMGSTVSPNWQTIVYKSGWSLNGNSGTNTIEDFIGTTDDKPLNFRVNNQKAGRIDNTAIGSTFLGYQSGNTSTGMYNIGVGYWSLYSNTTGIYNAVLGVSGLLNNTTGTHNIAIGPNSLFSNVAGSNGIAIGFAAMLFCNNSSTPFTNNNIAIGNNSLRGSDNASLNTGNNNIALGGFSLSNNSTGNFNNAIGQEALYSNTTGSANTAIGYEALYSNATGGSNVATGFSALHNNTNGNNNSAYGNNALYQNSSGENNTAIGYYAMQSSTTGRENTAIGYYALFGNGAGSYNTATGSGALKYNQGAANTAHGFEALNSTSSGYGNTANGTIALYTNTTGGYNTASGYGALSFNNNGHYNTAYGSFSLRYTISAQYNTAIGYSAGDTYNNGYNNVFVGANVDVNTADLFNVIAMGQGTIVTSGSSTARFGNSATVSYGGWAGWSNISDGRFKKDVQENVPGIDFINKLRPVTYHLAATELDAFLHKNDTSQISLNAKQWHEKALYDKEKIRYSGFVAQEVEAIAKQLGFDFSGIDAPRNADDTYGLRYAEFVVPLVKAMQEQQQMIEDLKKQNEEFLKVNTTQKKLVEELLKRIEKLESSLASKN